MVIFGTILGIYLEKSRACQRIAETLLQITGKDRAAGALALQDMSLPSLFSVMLPLYFCPHLLSQLHGKVERTLVPWA